MIIAYGILIAVMHAIGAAITPREAGINDDRDRDIARKGDVVSSKIIGLFLFMIVGLAVLREDWLTVNLAFVGMIVAEFAKAVWQVTLYRRSA